MESYTFIVERGLKRAAKLLRILSHRVCVGGGTPPGHDDSLQLAAPPFQS